MNHSEDAFEAEPPHPLSEFVAQLANIPHEHMGPIRYPSDPVIESVINEMLDRMALLFRERQSWLLSISHDLRSPITAIIANAELALHEKASADDLTNAAHVAHRNGTRLAELMDRMLEDATQIGTHGLPSPEIQSHSRWRAH